MLTAYGRTREQGYRVARPARDHRRGQGSALPRANGDITSLRKTQRVLHATGADAVMIDALHKAGPGCWARWVHYLHGQAPGTAAMSRRALLLEHLMNITACTATPRAMRAGRKHIAWYVQVCRRQKNFVRG